MNMTVTKIDTGSVILDNATHRDKTLALAASGSVSDGMVLATKQVADAIAVVAGANTGTGTVTLATVVNGAMVPAAGAYVLRCTTAVTNGGVFSLTDPNGAIVATGIAMTPGAGGATVVEVYGMQFTITDAGTDFIVGDSFTFTVAADGKLVLYSPTGAGGAQIPTDVFTGETVSVVDAGNVAIRSLIAGRVRKERLIVSPSTAAGEGVVEALRRVGIVAVDTQSLSQYDNEPA